MHSIRDVAARSSPTLTRYRRPPRSLRGLRVTSLFTGIVQGTAVVGTIQKNQDLHTLSIEFPKGQLQGVQTGASVALNGTCLTVTSSEGDRGYFDIIAETLRATNLGKLKAGDLVNFERSAKIGDEIGGHNVSGHIHTTAQIVEVKNTDNNRRLTFKVADQWLKYILPKGFIALDGISLTVGEIREDGFCVYLIPETLRVTVLGEKQEGDSVNLEIDAQTQAIVDTVEQVVARHLAERPELVQNAR